MKIDFHVHITPPDIIANWEKYAQKEPYFSLLYRRNSALKNTPKFATAQDTAAMLENDPVFDAAVVFGFAFCDMGLCRYVNDYVIESVKKYPKHLIGFAVVPAGSKNSKEAEAEIQRCFDCGLKGVGELFPAGQDMDLVNKKETEAITAVCKSLDIPLLLHTNEPVGHDYPGKTDIPMRHIETFVLNNQGLNIVLAHWGGGIFFYETMKEVKESFRNVYYDTSATPFLYESIIYRSANTLGLCEKVLFGSDFPLLHSSRYIPALEESGFNNKEKDMILGINARKLLKL